tara:strand:+ start:1599 stop:1955 length:357 start_codon:yes stop_codon:yes gene_type:complete
MGMSWGAVAGLLTSISPIVVPLLGGPAGAIVKAAASAVVIVENFVSNHRGEAKQQRALNLVMSLLTVAEDATAKDLMTDPLVAKAVEAVIDAEVATRNAHAALSALIEDIQGKRDGAT